MTDANPMHPYSPVLPAEHMEAMYPDVYRRVYPMVLMTTEMYDVPSNPGFYPYPTRAAVEQMADYIYQRTATDLSKGADVQQFGGPLFRSLILILLIRQLLRRRYSFYY